MKIIGFTGTRYGMSIDQKAELCFILRLYRDNFEFHHGDCIGADTQAHHIAKEYGAINIIIHPGYSKANPSNTDNRSFCITEKGSIREPLPHLDRNINIVNECGLLIACPIVDKPQKRGGTWFTINYANDLNKDTLVIPRLGLKHILATDL